MLLWPGILRHRRCRGSESAPRHSSPTSTPRILQRQRPQSQVGRGHPVEVAPRARRAFYVLPIRPPRSASARVGASGASTRFRGRLANFPGDPLGRFCATAWIPSDSSGLTYFAAVTETRRCQPRQPLPRSPCIQRRTPQVTTAASRSYSHTGRPSPLTRTLSEAAQCPICRAGLRL
ncbi:hypothetical protein NDU88_003085 [Pleurodeles waltl]|uniref:Uncharacterized protein n=1 Tax=Pleurodeles waltl TaxID=8319 RepID=A0AAV7SED5_PLEWA|nr:hypothetical protein NDU88_003085 [Pleurodeles waltl]